MEAVVKNRTFTVEEYFDLEKVSEIRHEFFYGQLIEMPGGTTEHHLMVKRLNRLLEDKLEPAGFIIYRETMKLAIPGGKQYFYPDLFASNETNTELNRYAKNAPALVIEITSDSTLKTDTIDKLIAYQKIPTLQYYLIVNPEQPEIAVFSRTKDGAWLSEVYNLQEQKIPLEAINMSLNLNEVYP